MRISVALVSAVLATVVVGVTLGSPVPMAAGEWKDSSGGTCDCPWETLSFDNSSCPQNCDSGTYTTKWEGTTGDEYKLKSQDACGDTNCHGYTLKSKKKC